MGQYYYIVNLDKRQYLHPHFFGDGLKLLEFGDSAGGTMCALAVLLASGNNRGGGDLRSDDPLIGSWAGDRVVIAGDYDDDGKWLPEGVKGNLYSHAHEYFENISEKVLVVMCEDQYLQRGLQERIAHFGGHYQINEATFRTVMGRDRTDDESAQFERHRVTREEFVRRNLAARSDLITGVPKEE